MVKRQQAVAEIIRQDPDVEGFMSAAGATGGSPTGNTGRIFMRLKDRSERQSHVTEVIARLRSKVSDLPGINVYLQNPPAIQIGGRATKSQYQYTLQGTDTRELYHYAPLLESALRELPGLQDVTSDLQITNPQVIVDIDRDKAQAYGVSAEQVEQALYSAYGSRQISTIYTPINQYKVILEVEPRYQRDPSSLAQLYIRSDSGRLVPVESVARLSRGVGPLTVNHTGQFASVTVSFNLKQEWHWAMPFHRSKGLCGTCAFPLP